jgi:hypothetical protein
MTECVLEANIHKLRTVGKLQVRCSVLAEVKLSRQCVCSDDVYIGC